MLLSQFIPPSPSPAVPTSLFSVSASLFLPCKQVYEYHFACLFSCSSKVYPECEHLLTGVASNMLVLQLRTETRGTLYIQGESLVLTHAWTVLEVNYFRCVYVSSWRLSICHLVHLTFAPRCVSKYERSDYLKEASSLGVLLIDIWGGLAFTPVLSWALYVTGLRLPCAFGLFSGSPLEHTPSRIIYNPLFTDTFQTTCFNVVLSFISRMSHFSFVPHKLVLVSSLP